MKVIEFIRRNPSHAMIFAGLIGLTMALGFTGYYYKSIEGQINKITNLRNGLNICSSRVSQTYFAQVNGASSASALSGNFLSQTDECFFQFDRSIKAMESLGLSNYSVALYDEFISFKNMVKNFSSGSIALASLTKSYNDIDQEKFDLASKLSVYIRENKNQLTFLKYVIAVCIGAFGILGVFFLAFWRKWDRKVKDIEDQAMNLLDDYINNSARVERLLERVFDHIHLPVLKNLFLEYHHHVLGRAYPGNKPIEMESDGRHSHFEDDDTQVSFSFLQGRHEERDHFDDCGGSLEESGEQAEELSLKEEEVSFSEDASPEDAWVSLDSNRVVAEDLTTEESEDTEKKSSELLKISRKVKEIHAKEESEVEEDLEIATSSGSREEETLILNTLEFEESDDGPSLEVKGKEAETSIEESFQKVVMKLSRAYIKRNKESGVFWEFSSSYKDFALVQEIETLEQVVHCILSRFVKSFNELDVPEENRLLKVSLRETNNKHVIVSLAAKDALFNTAELEFFNGGSRSLKKLVNTNLVMTHELLAAIAGDVTLENIFTENNDKEGILSIHLPIHITNLQTKADEAQPVLTRLVSGTKDKLLKTLRRETTI